MAAGGDDYLLKPVSPVVLRAKMNAMERIRAIQSNLVNTREQLRRTVERLELAAHVDGLTDLPNRRRLDAKLHEELQRSKRAEKPFSVILMDIDRFKPYNDALGHLAGDDCLKRVAGTLARGIVRAGDLVGRFGGEEFTAVLPATPLPGALIVAERLRASIEGLALPHPSGGFVTVSCGVSACCSQRASVAELMTTADAALYEAKASGRNLVCARPLRYD
jgi:diguanylate cyclase (GGDEF)-like protein